MAAEQRWTERERALQVELTEVAAAARAEGAEANERLSAALKAEATEALTAARADAAASYFELVATAAEAAKESAPSLLPRP